MECGAGAEAGREKNDKDAGVRVEVRNIEKTQSSAPLPLKSAPLLDQTSAAE